MASENAGAPTDAWGYAYLKRSNGTALLVAAWLCLAVAIVLLLVAVLTKTTNFMGEIDTAAIVMRGWLLLASYGLFGAWGMFFAVGQIVRALFFLDGTAEKPAR